MVSSEMTNQVDNVKKCPEFTGPKKVIQVVQKSTFMFQDFGPGLPR